MCLPHTYWLRSREKAGAACLQRGLFCPGGSVLRAPSCHSQCGAGQLASQGRAGQGRAAKTNRIRQVSEQAEQDPSHWHRRAGARRYLGLLWALDHIPLSCLCQRGLPAGNTTKVHRPKLAASKGALKHPIQGPLLLEDIQEGLGHEASRDDTSYSVRVELI